jgi:putrescine transport system substrate-binding protein
MWFDQMAIPADAPHVAEAHEFLNYLMKPEVIAKSSNYVYYANGNKASQAFVDKEVLDDPNIYPTEDVLAKLYTTSPLDSKSQRLLTRMWTTVVTGQ